jgi:hypothetical protein
LRRRPKRQLLFQDRGERADGSDRSGFADQVTCFDKYPKDIGRERARVVRVGTVVLGHVPGVVGNATLVVGNVAHFVGNVAHVVGNVAHVVGNVAHVVGNVAHLVGNVAHLVGNVTHVVGNVTLEVGHAASLSHCIRVPGRQRARYRSPSPHFMPHLYQDSRER